MEILYSGTPNDKEFRQFADLTQSLNRAAAAGAKRILCGWSRLARTFFSTQGSFRSSTKTSTTLSSIPPGQNAI